MKRLMIILAAAFRLKGVPYLWGGMTPKGVDCSGLVRWSYLMNLTTTKTLTDSSPHDVCNNQNLYNKWT